MAELSALGTEKQREFNKKHGVSDNQFGLKMGDLRVIAKRIKLDPELAAKLWESGNFDARLLAILLMKPKQLSLDELEHLVATAEYPQIADWLSSYVVKAHPQKEARREEWMNAENEMKARMGWSLTAERIVKDPDGLDLPALLDRIEAEMGGAPRNVQWTMNYCLAETGIEFAEHRDRALAIGEKIGAFRDYPTSKGCTSPFAPIWIAEMVRRKS